MPNSRAKPIAEGGADTGGRLRPPTRSRADHGHDPTPPPPPGAAERSEEGPASGGDGGGERRTNSREAAQPKKGISAGPPRQEPAPADARRAKRAEPARNTLLVTRYHSTAYGVGAKSVDRFTTVILYGG